MDELYTVLRKCRYFYGIPEERYPNVLSCLKAEKRRFKKGEKILCLDDRSELAGIIISGTLQQVLYDEAGNPINLNQISAGDAFGAELACSRGISSPTEFLSTTDSEVLFCNFYNVMNPEGKTCPYRQRVAANLLSDLADQVIYLDLRLRIMGQKVLRNKIRIYLQNQRMDEDGIIHLPFKRIEWANYLYADRSALSREMGRLQKEGVLISNKSAITILDQSFLSEK